jgi:hypothetical protein
VIPNDVMSFIARKFDLADREMAASILAGAKIHDGSAASPRLIRCAAVASGGSLERLRAQVEELMVDWRDVIISGEYDSVAGELLRIRDLDDPIPDDA